MTLNEAPRAPARAIFCGGPPVSLGGEILVPRSQNPIFLQGKYSINIILARGTDGGTPGALTGAGAVLNLENH